MQQFEFAPDETLALLVPLGERIYINSILCLFYLFLKMWEIDSNFVSGLN